MKGFYCAVIVIFVALFFTGAACAADLIHQFDSSPECSERLGVPFGSVIQDESNLIEAYKNYLSKDEEDVVKIITRAGIDFEKQVVLFIIGEQSVEGYDMAVVDSQTTYSKGILKVVVKITRPPRSSFSAMRKKNPIYFYKTDPSLVKIKDAQTNERLLKKVEFYEKGLSAPFAVWPEQQ